MCKQCKYCVKIFKFFYWARFSPNVSSFLSDNINDATIGIYQKSNRTCGVFNVVLLASQNICTLKKKNDMVFNVRQKKYNFLEPIDLDFHIMLHVFCQKIITIQQLKSGRNLSHKTCNTSNVVRLAKHIISSHQRKSHMLVNKAQICVWWI